MPAGRHKTEMADISLHEVTRDNCRDSLQLSVHPEQQRFIADYAPIAAIALAKAFVRPGGLVWAPYAIYADAEMVGFVELAYAPTSVDQYWAYHFFIDRSWQGKVTAKQRSRRSFSWSGGNTRRVGGFSSLFIPKIRRLSGFTPAPGFGRLARSSSASQFMLSTSTNLASRRGRYASIDRCIKNECQIG
jgi:hypothetical protein